MAEPKRSTAKRTPVPNVPPNANRAALDTEPSAPSVDSANLTLFHEKLYDLSLASLDRVRSAGVAVQIVAGVAGVLYAAVLAVILVTTDAPPTLRAIVAPLFFGLGLVLGALSLAAGRLPRTTDGVGTSGGTQDRADSRLSFFTSHVERSVAASTWRARSGAVAVAVGIAAAALPFVGLPAAAVPEAAVPAAATTISTSSTLEWPAPPEVGSKITEATYYKIELYRAELAETIAAADREFAAQQAQLLQDAEDARAEAAADDPPAPSPLDTVPVLAGLVAGGLLLTALPAVVAAITRPRRIENHD